MYIIYKYNNNNNNNNNNELCTGSRIVGRKSSVGGYGNHRPTGTGTVNIPRDRILESQG